MFLVTLSSKHGQSDYKTDSSHLHETLRTIGLEWKTADQFHDHEVIITIRPYEPNIEEKVKELEDRLASIAEVASV
jgi:hypothetical protein